MQNTPKGSHDPRTPQCGAAPCPSTTAPVGTQRSLRGEPIPACRDFFPLGLGKTEKPPGGKRLASELGFDNQELMYILDFNPMRLGPCARCNLSSNSGSKCSPSAEVLALRFWFGPSFHGKLNNRMRERKGERAREKKKKTKLSADLPKVERTKTHFGFISSETELFPSRSGTVFQATFFNLAFY